MNKSLSSCFAWCFQIRKPAMEAVMIRGEMSLGVIDESDSQLLFPLATQTSLA